MVDDNADMQTGRYKAYPEYKDSGVEWVDDIPNGWSIERIKRMLVLKRSLVGTASNEYQLLSLTLKGVIPRDISSGEGKIPASFDTYQEVDRNDLVFCLFDIDETPRTIGLSPSKGMITGAYNVYKTTNKCLPNYAYYYFLYIDLRKGLRPFYTGLRKVVRSETFSNIEMPCPSYEEQQKIANFLDYETAKIDTLIEKQQRLTELLTEKRQAVISHAVTKGLNPDVPMKDSGVEWLGEVPAHWEISKLKYYSGIQGGYAFNSQSFSEQGIQVLKIANVYQNRLALERQPTYVSEKMVDILPEFVVQSNDILMSLTGTLGKRDYGFAVKVESEGKYLLNQRVAKLNPIDSKIDRDFLIYTLWSESYLNQLYSLPSGTKQANLSNSDVLDIWIAIPPTKVEQEEVANKLAQEKDVFDQLVLKAQQAIQLMQERRTALISAAVTGKIDVRDWVKPE